MTTKNNDFRKTSIKVAKLFCLKMKMTSENHFLLATKNMFKIEFFKIWSVGSHNNFESIRRKS